MNEVILVIFIKFFFTFTVVRDLVVKGVFVVVATCNMLQIIINATYLYQ
jgi:hypothetical protein